MMNFQLPIFWCPLRTWCPTHSAQFALWERRHCEPEQQQQQQQQQEEEHQQHQQHQQQQQKHLKSLVTEKATFEKMQFLPKSILYFVDIEKSIFDFTQNAISAVLFYLVFSLSFQTATNASLPSLQNKIHPLSDDCIDVFLAQCPYIRLVLTKFRVFFYVLYRLYVDQI